MPGSQRATVPVGEAGGAGEQAPAALTAGAYDRLQRLLTDRICVLLDGGMATELEGFDGDSGLDEVLWGTRALVERPDAVRRIHARYVALDCDVISTDTWGLPSWIHGDRHTLGQPSHEPVHWMDVARRGVRLARDAVEQGEAAGRCSVAFSLNGMLDAPDARETIRLLGRVFDDEPPDLILLETLSVVRDSLYETVAALLDTGVPLWLSFRRCRQGLCGVFGQHWGGPEGDAFGRAARRFERLGVGALLVNCIPPDHVDGLVSYLRDFTDLPLGVYPNLGYYTNQGWQFERGVGGSEYAEMALRWREEGAQIIGGCCGVGPEHIEAARAALAGTPAGSALRQPSVLQAQPATVTVKPWTDGRGRSLYPLPFPELLAEEGVSPPGGSSLMVWKHLFTEGIGAHQRCLDAGSGTGLLAVQLALNGAAHVHAIDVDGDAVSSTLGTAFRNGVAERVSASTADLYAWVPEEPYEVIVADLWQTPADPFQQFPGHRPEDYWGRNLVDHLFRKLPQALAPEGVAYVVHLSLLSQATTDALLEQCGLQARVADYTVHPFPPLYQERLGQIERVEALSDAYHIELGTEHVMVTYLLEIRHRDAVGWGDAI